MKIVFLAVGITLGSGWGVWGGWFIFKSAPPAPPPPPAYKFNVATNTMYFGGML